MNSMLVGTCEYLEREIEYYMISDVTEDGVEVYGVSVRFDDEQISIPDISTSKEAVQELLTSMMSGSVSPISTQDVVEDWMAQ